MGWSGEPEGWEHGHMSRRTAELPSLVLKEDLGKNGKRKQKRKYTGYGVIRSCVSAGFFQRENPDLNCAGVTAVDGLGRMDGRIHRAQQRDRN
jgi:hypothetical protein